MGTDQLIELLSKVSYKLLPIAGLILLIFAIILIYNLNALSKELKEQTKKLDKPLNAVGALSETVEEINGAANKAVKSSLTVVNTKLDDMKEKMATKKQAKNNMNNAEVIVNENNNEQ